MKPGVTHSRQVTLSILAGLTAMAGCSYNSSPNGVAIHGQVTFQGKPLSEGLIMFSPPFKSTGRGGSSQITKGKYQISRENGPFPGKLLVQISSFETISDGIDGTSTKTIVSSQIPKYYNTDTTLQIVLPDRKSVSYTFDLK